MSILDKHRDKMIATLIQRGIHDEQVLQAMRVVPREEFVPAPLRPDSYRDAPLPIGNGQTISQPYVVALMTQLLQIKKGDKILEIGTGSGYQAAILAQLGAWVFTIERHRPLWQEAEARFRKLKYDRIIARCGDGTMGWSAAAPFAGIIVTAAGPDIPQPLLDQLDKGGRMVIPTGGRESQSLVLISRSADGQFKRENAGSVAFVPLIGKNGWEK